MKNDICPYWREYDNYAGLYEYCKKHSCKCSCCGSLERCLKPEEENEYLAFANRLLKYYAELNLIGR